jgi:hypothetical protein
MEKKPILVVDDEKNIRMTMSQSLEDLEIPVKTAVNGEEALQKLRKEPFALVFLDLKMPGMAGMPPFDAVNHAFAAVSTGGFSTVGYGNWNAFGVFLLIVLMLIGGGTCSTAGGIKQFRVYLLWKLLSWDIRRSLMPRTAILEPPYGRAIAVSLWMTPGFARWRFLPSCTW